MTHRRLGVHYFIRSGLLAFFAYYILRLVKQEQLIIYIGPRMQLYVKLAAIGFYMMAVIQIYLAFRTYWGERTASDGCGCGGCSPANSTAAGRSIFYGLFAVPVLLFLLLPDAALSSSLIAKKGITLTGAGSDRPVQSSRAEAGPEAGAPTPASAGAAPAASASAASTLPASATPVAAGPTASLTLPSASVSPQETDASTDSLDALFPHDQYSEDLAKLAKKLYKQDFISIEDTGFMEVVSSIDFYMNNFIGKKVDITGFVYREDDMQDNQFVVSRFAVQCCSADASPFGFMAESSLGKDLKKDTWVKITGILGTTSYGGNEILKIEASKIERIPAPKTPYVFPNYDFFQTATRE
ncbi:MAG: hypothetical protein K0R57_5029 [Paenibacillaceae bacterium]|jgi:uncharacterized repeat protein (TIGR03943 family)|nr:hypothetical protein [Paenibacillaceae bacterium]